MNVLNEFFQKVFVVTTLNDVERTGYIKRLFSSIGLTYEFFTAPNSFYIKNTINDYSYYPDECAPPEVYSLLTANQSILSNCIYNNIDSVLIIEDDIKLENGWENLFLEFIKTVPDDWGILNMGKHYSDTENRLQLVNGIYNIPIDIWNTVCVGFREIITMKKTLDYILQTTCPLDAIYGKVYRESEIKCYSPVKKIFSQLSYREKHVIDWNINKDDYRFLSKIGR
jgi:GR25 family glycosyltransferase involved in LPS biosynthesis